MKKNILLLSFLLFSITVFGNKKTFTITGKVPNKVCNGKNVHLQRMNNGNVEDLGSVPIKNNTFVFSGEIEDLLICFIALPEGCDDKMSEIKYVHLILEPGNIEVEIDPTPMVKGTPMNNEFQIFSSKIKTIEVQLKQLWEQGENSETKKQISESRNLLIKTIFDYTKSNIQNTAGEHFLVDQYKLFSAKQLGELLGGVRPSFKTSESGKALLNYYNLTKNTDIGSAFTNINALTPDGKAIALSDYVGKGKYVLVDFWASWCAPCRKEMPKIVAIYNKYKDKGFEIVGVSLDEDGDSWQKSIKSLQMTWPQMSDLKGWDSALGKPYGVRSIPFTLLLDKDGNIIAKNLRAEALEEKLKEIIK